MYVIFFTTVTQHTSPMTRFYIPNSVFLSLNPQIAVRTFNVHLANTTILYVTFASSRGRLVSITLMIVRGNAVIRHKEVFFHRNSPKVHGRRHFWLHFTGQRFIGTWDDAAFLADIWLDMRHAKVSAGNQQRCPRASDNQC
jgi:hypothetical protein